VRPLVDPGGPPPRYVPVLDTAGYSEHLPPSAQVGRFADPHVDRNAPVVTVPVPGG
jgi:hypothetical protein